MAQQGHLTAKIRKRWHDDVCLRNKLKEGLVRQIAVERNNVCQLFWDLNPASADDEKLKWSRALKVWDKGAVAGRRGYVTPCSSIL